MWRDEIGLVEMLFTYIAEVQEFKSYENWRPVLVDILSCHEESRRYRDIVVSKIIKKEVRGVQSGGSEKSHQVTVKEINHIEDRADEPTTSVINGDQQLCEVQYEGAVVPLLESGRGDSPDDDQAPSTMKCEETRRTAAEELKNEFKVEVVQVEERPQSSPILAKEPDTDSSFESSEETYLQCRLPSRGSLEIPIQVTEDAMDLGDDSLNVVGSPYEAYKRIHSSDGREVVQGDTGESSVIDKYLNRGRTYLCPLQQMKYKGVHVITGSRLSEHVKRKHRDMLKSSGLGGDATVNDLVIKIKQYTVEACDLLDEYTNCPICDIPQRKKNLSKHLNRLHGTNNTELRRAISVNDAKQVIVSERREKEDSDIFEEFKSFIGNEDGGNLGEASQEKHVRYLKQLMRVCDVDDLIELGLVPEHRNRISEHIASIALQSSSVYAATLLALSALFKFVACCKMPYVRQMGLEVEVAAFEWRLSQWSRSNSVSKEKTNAQPIGKEHLSQDNQVVLNDLLVLRPDGATTSKLASKVGCYVPISREKSQTYRFSKSQLRISRNRRPSTKAAQVKAFLQKYAGRKRYSNNL